jgi:hypothetical protein
MERGVSLTQGASMGFGIKKAAAGVVENVQRKVNEGAKPIDNLKTRSLQK